MTTEDLPMLSLFAAILIAIVTLIWRALKPPDDDHSDQNGGAQSTEGVLLGSGE